MAFSGCKWRRSSITVKKQVLSYAFPTCCISPITLVKDFPHHLWNARQCLLLQLNSAFEMSYLSLDFIHRHTSIWQTFLMLRDPVAQLAKTLNLVPVE